MNLLLILLNSSDVIPNVNVPIAAFFCTASFLFFILVHIFGAKLFIVIRYSGRMGPHIFAINLFLIGVAGAVLSASLLSGEAALVLGVTSGILIWTAAGDIPEQMKWISPLTRKSIIIYLPLLLIWGVGCYYYSNLPHALIGATGYPMAIWGLNLARSRVLARWGPSSLPSTVLIILTAMLAGGAAAVGIVHGTIFSGIIGGILFSIAIWSALEVIWERGMARGPWQMKNKN